MTAVIVIAVILALVAGHHAGRAHANYRHHGKRGVNLYWSSVRGPWVSIPGPFNTRIGHRL